MIERVAGAGKSHRSVDQASRSEASEVLGGVSRMTFQMSTASLETAAMKRSIRLLGTEVAPIVRTATQ